MEDMGPGSDFVPWIGWENNVKLKAGFLTYETNGEQILVAADSKEFAGLARSNATAAFIVDCLKEECSEEQLLHILVDRYDAPQDVIAADLAAILAQLRGIGALDE